ncbi:MAG: RNA degradosome polyphosphate kinase [Janthinobacterium lividum]
MRNLKKIKLSNVPVDLTKFDQYINRELSWLSFNVRVLEEARNADHPLLERLRFLSISDSNLDEFYMVRVAAYKSETGIINGKNGFSYQNNELLLKQIVSATDKLIQEQTQMWRHLRHKLKDANFEILNVKELKKDELEWLEEYFDKNIFPTLSPLAIDPVHPFPWIPNRGLAITFKLKNDQNDKISHEILSIPPMVPRFVHIPAPHPRFVPLEQVIMKFHKILLPGFTVMEQGVFRVLRDSELGKENEFSDLLEYYEVALKRQRRGNAIRLTVDRQMPNDLKKFVVEHVNTELTDIYEVDELVGFGDIAQLISHGQPDLRYPVYKPRFPRRILSFGGDCFSAIKSKDLVVHHPFESFDVFLQFLHQAAHDPQVIAIKQTLYRTSKDSAIVQELIAAAEMGKTVIALIEIRARFDEEININFARDLERAGVQVVYGFLDLKTHAKLTLVVRREGEETRSYAHFGTGNYHPINAKFYTDLSFFTSQPDLCSDAALVFNYITGGAAPQKLKKIAVSPINLRSSLVDLIENEIDAVQQGKPGAIWIKVNALVDEKMAALLYKASQAGVNIDLIVRGMCCVRPGIPGLSDNIHVKSVIGRFLEHSRIFCFGNGHTLPSNQAKVFISSADWMTRNLDHRVELMIPIENLTVHAQIMNEVMGSYMKDKAQTWEMQGDGQYHHVKRHTKSFSAHQYFMTHASLSGVSSGDFL